MKFILNLLICLIPGLIYSQIDTTYLNKFNLNNLKTGVWKENIPPNENKNINEPLIGYFTYSNGVKNGDYEVYNSQNILITKGTLEKGKPDGEILSYYPNGTLKSKINYSKNLMNGSFKIFWKNGKIKTYKDYRKGVIVGKIEHFDAQGNLIISIKKDASNSEKELWRFYHENGQIKAQGYKFKNENIGMWKEYSISAELIKTIKY